MIIRLRHKVSYLRLIFGFFFLLVLLLYNKETVFKDAYSVIVFFLLATIYSAGVIFLPNNNKRANRVMLDDEGATLEGEYLFRYEQIRDIKEMRVLTDYIVQIKTEFDLVEVIPWTKKERIALIKQVLERSKLEVSDSVFLSFNKSDLLLFDQRKFATRSGLERLVDKFFIKAVIILILVTIISTNMNILVTSYYMLLSPKVAGVNWPRSTTFYTVGFDEPYMLKINEPFVALNGEWPEGTIFHLSHRDGKIADISIKPNREFKLFGIIWKKETSVDISRNSTRVRSPKSVVIEGVTYPRRKTFVFKDGEIDFIYP